MNTHAPPEQGDFDPDLASTPSRPVLLLVDDDPAVVRDLGRELDGRYGATYCVMTTSSADEALVHLTALADQGEDVALIIADQWMPAMTGIELLTRAHDLCPRAKRALLIDYGDPTAGPPILQAMALGRIDYYVTKPWVPADDLLHPAITELLSEWTRANRQRVAMLTIVGAEDDPRCHELQDLLNRNAIPAAFYPDASPTGRRLLRDARGDSNHTPAVLFHDGRVLPQPSNVDIAEALGVKTSAPDELFDVAIIGAGPAGLAAAVYAASEGLRVVVVEGQALGGQAGTSSLIRNYLGFPRGLSGTALTERAYRQAWFFGAEFVFTQAATALRVDGDKRIVTLADGSELSARTVILATGVSYRRLGVPGIDDLLGRGVFYGAAASEAPAMQDRAVCVVGAGNSAGQTAIHLAKYARRVTMLVRGDSLAASMSDYLVQEISRTSNIDVRLHTDIIDGHGTHRLDSVVLRDRRSGAVHTMPTDALFILIGATPTTEWLDAERDAWGFIRTGRDVIENDRAVWPLERPPFPMETSLPGVFAVGDVRSQSIKRVASAVGEGSVVVSFIHQYLVLPAVKPDSTVQSTATLRVR